MGDFPNRESGSRCRVVLGCRRGLGYVESETSWTPDRASCGWGALSPVCADAFWGSLSRLESLDNRQATSTLVEGP